MDTPSEVCEKRDVKGLYKKAREGKIKGVLIPCTYDSSCAKRIKFSIKNYMLCQVHSVILFQTLFRFHWNRQCL